MNRFVSFLIGTVVLGGVAVLSWILLRSSFGEADRAVQSAPAPAGSRAAPPADIVALANAPAAVAPGADGGELRGVGGIVLLPDGRPAAGASVTLCRQLSAWPEWQCEPLDRAVTGSEGEFRFRIERGPNLLVQFEHSAYAGDLQEAPPCQPELVLQLRRGFEVEGVVVNDAGFAVAGATVALDAPVGDLRRSQRTRTSRSGRFRFQNVPSGVVRVVARHDWWQPKVLQNVVVGVDRSLELRFERPALQLEGRVVSATTQEPVANALVLALPPGQSIGQHEPAIAATRGDGVFRLGGLARGNLNLEVRHPDFAVAMRTVVIGPAPTPLSFDLVQRVAVQGRLVADDLPGGAASLEGVVLTLRSAADEITATAVLADGTFSFPRRVTPGWAALRIDDDRCAFRASGSSRLPVRITEQRDDGLDLPVVPPAELVGRIVDAGGAPVAGARITVTQVEMFAERLRQAGSALLERDIGKLGDQFARSSASEPESLLGVSGADGAFSIAGLPPGRVALRIAHPSRGVRRVEHDVPQPGERSESILVELPAACRIAGRVLRGGRPLAGAQVWVVVEGLQMAVVTGLDGRYELSSLPPGDYRVRARYSTLPAVVSPRPERVTPVAPGRVDLEFPPGRVVTGTVIGSEKQPVEKAMVLVRGETGMPAITDASGGFQLEAPSRAFELQVIFGDRSARHLTSVAADVDRVTIEVDTPPNCTINARIAGLPGRQPVGSVLLRIGAPRGEDDGGVAQTRWIEVDDGQLRYPWFPAGAWRVTFWSEGYAPLALDLDLASGEERDLGELRLEPACSLDGRIVDDSGRAIPGAEILLGEPADLDLLQPQLRSDAEGRFTVRGVCTAADQLVVRAPGYATRSIQLRLPQDVLAREPLSVMLERGSTIEVRFVGDAAAEGGIVLLRRFGRVLATAEIDESGRALFPNCGVGDYVVQRFGDDRFVARARVRRSGEPVRVVFE